MSSVSQTGKPSANGNIEDITSSFPLPLPTNYLYPYQIYLSTICLISSLCLDEDYTIIAFVGEDTSIVRISKSSLLKL